jgi:chemotaxis signal transduction protein
MNEHVCARCGDFFLLFPAENIVFIEPVPGQTRFGDWLHRSRGAVTEPVLDLRRLLDVPAPAPPENGVTLRWRATAGARQLRLLVDAVEEIVRCYAGDLIDVPLLPRRLRPLCDQVMRDPSGRLRLRVKADVELPFERTSDRRRYARALLTMERSP